MTEWWDFLTETSQISIISASINAASALLVVLTASVITFCINRSMNKRQLNHSSTLAKEQIRAVGLQKIADFRIRWIEDLRKDLVNLYELQYELNLIRRRRPVFPGGGSAPNRRRQLWIEIAAVKQDIILRINPDSDHADEVKLKSLLKKTVSGDRRQARLDRKEISEVANRVLRTEWNKLKSELRVKEKED